MSIDLTPDGRLSIGFTGTRHGMTPHTHLNEGRP